MEKPLYFTVFRKMFPFLVTSKEKAQNYETHKVATMVNMLFSPLTCPWSVLRRCLKVARHLHHRHSPFGIDFVSCIAIGKLRNMRWATPCLNECTCHQWKYVFCVKILSQKLNFWNISYTILLAENRAFVCSLRCYISCAKDLIPEKHHKADSSSTFMSDPFPCVLHESYKKHALRGKHKTKPYKTKPNKSPDFLRTC